MNKPLKVEHLTRLLGGIYQGKVLEINNIQIDSRLIKPGDAFIALRGQQYDGHHFINAAFQQGAILAIVSQPVVSPISCLQVKDTLWALGVIAHYIRSLFAGPVVGITGSCGKTTVKELLASLLRSQGKVCATQGNFNNEIGTPLTLMRLDDDYYSGVIEMAAKKLGDIQYLTNLTLPDVAVILNAKPSHLEGFGSLDTIAQTKGEILSALKQTGLAILPYEDDFFSIWRKQVKANQLLTFGLTAQADVWADKIQFTKEGYSVFYLKAFNHCAQVTLPLLGRHNIYNFLAAVAAALAVGMDFSHIVTTVPSLAPLDNRLAFKTGIKGVSLVDDSYNANPAGVKAALDSLQYLPHQRKLFVFADMAELGDESVLYHEEIGRYARQAGVEKMYCYGEKVHYTVNAFGDKASVFSTYQLLIAAIKADCRDDTVILIKGSRLFQLENVIVQLEA